MSPAPPPTPMVSYEQHFEDVRLARCFPEIAQGFYIDVGAWHPMLDSVTCHFYKRGWHGINVEPTPSAHALLQRYRPRDRNLACVLGDRAGEQTLHVVDGSGLSTTSAQYADRAHAAGLAVRAHTAPRCVGQLPGKNCIMMSPAHRCDSTGADNECTTTARLAAEPCLPACLH